jgi:hypothetical protein
LGNGRKKDFETRPCAAGSVRKHRYRFVE